MKYIKAIRKEFEREVSEPSDELVRLLVNKCYDKPLIASRMVTFREYTKRAITNSINDSISLRLKSALNINENIGKQQEPKSENNLDSNTEIPKYITTEDKRTWIMMHEDYTTLILAEIVKVLANYWQR